MRRVMMAAALFGTGACGGGKEAANNIVVTTKSAGQPKTKAPATANAAAPTANTISANTALAAADAMPADFPSDDRDANGANCYVFLSLTMQAENAAAGPGDEALNQARTRWRSDLRLRMNEEQVTQLTASNVNIRLNTPAAQRDAASRWCVEHAAGRG